MEYVRAVVAGVLPVRDSVTNQPVHQNNEVVLAVREPGTQKVVCGRHPRRGLPDMKAECACRAVLIEPLLVSGAIRDVTPYKPKAEKA